MQKSMTISAKGQVTLPKELREALGVQAGDTLIFSMVGGEVLITPKNIDFNDLAGFLGTPPKGPATLEEIDAAIMQAGGEAAAGPVRSSPESDAA